MKIELIRITENPEEIIEQAARTCYKSSFKNNPSFIRNLIKSGHESVLEHASATFQISGVSRALTHQLARHRLASYSQQSQRYVKEDQFEYVIPPSVEDLIEKKGGDFVAVYKNHMRQIQEMYNYWKKEGLKNEDARFLLPNACCTEIIMTANMREWRHIVNIRCDKNAQWEIRNMCLEILKILYLKTPNVFHDLYNKYTN